MYFYPHVIGWQSYGLKVFQEIYLKRTMKNQTFAMIYSKVTVYLKILHIRAKDS